MVQDPRVRFRPELLVRPGEGAKLRVEFSVDNAPADSRLAFDLARYQEGTIVDVIPLWEAEAKRRHVGFHAGGEAGSLLFEASVRDWTKEFDVAGIHRPTPLRASLIDPLRATCLRPRDMDLVLDDLPPEVAYLETSAWSTRQPLASPSMLPSGLPLRASRRWHSSWDRRRISQGEARERPTVGSQEGTIVQLGGASLPPPRMRPVRS